MLDLQMPPALICGATLLLGEFTNRIPPLTLDIVILCPAKPIRASKSDRPPVKILISHFEVILVGSIDALISDSL